MQSTSSFVRKEPCPKCGSRNNLARYSDGHAHCFSTGCDYYEPASDGSIPPKRRPSVARDIFRGEEHTALRARGITEETCRKFDYRVGTLSDGRKVQVAPYFNQDGDLTGTKVRPKDKDGMFTTGDMSDCQLFGQQLWGEGGRKVVVVEGEIDTLTVSQVQGNKWPTVGLPKGTKDAKTSISRNLKWLCSFDEVILMFDMDEPGQLAAKECAVLFPPGKCKVASLTRKDPNELLQAGEGDLIINAIWQAKPYRPDGVVKLSDLRDEILTEPTMGLGWFSETLTNLTYGRRWGETYGFGAGTGIGKTDWFTQQIQHDVMVLNEKVGLFFLEQKPAETAKRVAGKFAGKAFHVPDGTWTKEELLAVVDQLEADDRISLYDSFGSAEWDTVAATIRHMAHHDGIRLFYLDHLTALADPENEKESLEKIMKSMAMLAQELSVIIHFVSHLATPEGKPHEEGGRVMIRHFKGSRAIGFWSHFMFGLERDQQHYDPRWRSITTFRVLKDRNTGRSTGNVIHFGYDSTTCRLFETTPPDEGETKHGFHDTTLNDDDRPF